ncbi:ABC transporter substrate-binding protein [Clostridium botulinum]|uniref:ABC transporter substrate-binding protein n=1 Tax=unclassified Clostridium TaxID=2614128 RepID=UPI000503FAB3|nr:MULTISPECIES: ABC transporter substrate-binding protein [unclassified Clostridium]KFX59641.1 ABC transporter substrate-binding protein [Clostridium botulinum]MBY6779267.1 ABC transporter substrate-binding protein [Clostridium botulinum]MBY6852445.1 ABC transporter substrate-binding protein [Clostridium botulinum]MBY7007638.1 ABC transporter substrate-binding protein [Clostridium botulinum]NFF23157.1 ABC transporter substrate-binding protein [Clostridium botulinum]
MKRIFKKGFAIGLALMISVGLISCNTGKSKETFSSNGKIKVEYWYGLGGKLGKNMDNIINDFNNSQDKYEVKGISQEDYDATFKNLQAAIAAKKTPALVVLEPDKGAILNNKDALADISNYTAEDSDFNSDNYIKSFFESCKKDNKLYAFPMFGTTQVLYYNKKEFENAGISKDSLNTWSKIAEASKKVIKKDGDETKFYGWEPMWGADNLIDASLSNGGSILSEDGSKVLINSPEWVEVWDNFRMWIHDDKIMKVNSSGQGWEYWYSTIDDVMQDRAGGYTGSSGDQGDLDFEKLGAIEQPAFKDGKEAKPIAQARLLVMPNLANEEAKKGAYEFIKYFTSPEVNAKWSIASGYIPVNKAACNTDAFKEYVEKNPQALVPITQALHASKSFIDPTNGKIYDALKVAADKVELENVSAQEALDEAEKIAQSELDKTLKKQ